MSLWKPIATITVLSAALLLYQFPSPEPTYSHAKMSELVQAFQKLNKSCFILGASGESGKALIKELLRSKPFSRVVLIGRRKLEFPDDQDRAKLEQRVIDFDKLEEHKRDFEGFDVGYCCLGTTRGKSGAEGFVKIEHDYVVGSAKLAKEGGCGHFHVVSSTGVNENSSFLYQKTKGRTDREVSEMGFNRASIYRPAFLLCDREESRPVEAVVRFLLKPVACIAPTAITTPIDILAKAMVMNTISDSSLGAEIIDNKKIHALGQSMP